MSIQEPLASTLHAALQGSLADVDAIVSAIQPGVYKLAVHTLGNRDDAADATQEILLKVLTHLAGFRAESSFATWVWRIAYNHLLTARTRKAESPEVSLDDIATHLSQGLDFAAQLAQIRGEPVPLTPRDKLEARQTALACTQSMLMALDRGQRLVYVIDTIFGMDSKEAAEMLGISPAAYRQRLSRARHRLETFMANNCGLCNPKAACQCSKQLPAVRHMASSRKPETGAVVAVHRSELREAEQRFNAFTRVCNAASVFRSHPDYLAPATQRATILAVLSQEGFMTPGNPLQ